MDALDAVLTLRPEPADVRLARDFCVRHVAAVVPDGPLGTDFIDAAEMITSELVTNAVRAGAQAVSLHLTLSPAAEPRILRIGVRDDAVGEVASTQTDPLGVDGRGLRIVTMLAERWGVDEVPEGKLVWADLNLPGPDPAPS